MSPPYLYRITSFRHVVDMFASRELHLASPAEWKDPFETILRHRRSGALFAQCWCKKAVSDAMWKLYSPSHTSIRIRTTRPKLLAFAAAHTNASTTTWIRDVDYKRRTTIRSELLWLAQRLRERYSVDEAASALFLKRDAFDHENEVRMVVHDQRMPDSCRPTPSLRLPVQPHELIESIMFDPQVDPAFYQACRHYLQTVIGFSGSIGKSALYRLQKQLVVE